MFLTKLCTRVPDKYAHSVYMYGQSIYLINTKYE